jgi:pimeloyl-ACP methyl ester carboxylesterase
MNGTDRLRGGTLTTPDGCRLTYLAEGAGPTVVFAHGGLTRGSSWMAVADQLRDTFTCVLLDQRAHGASDWGGGPSIEQAAADLLTVIEHVGPVHALVGHSYGALAALEAARTAPSGMIPRLAVYEPPLSLATPIMSEAVLERVEAAVDGGDYEDALLLHLGSEIGGLSEAEVDAFRANPMLRSAYGDLVIQAPSIATALRTCTPLGSAEPYRAIDIPTLLLLGTNSAPDPFRTSVEALLHVLPQGQLALLEGQSHMAVLFAPHLVAAALQRFLAGVTADAHPPA